MADTLMELYAKPTLSILVEQSQNQLFISKFVCKQLQRNTDQQRDAFKQVYKKMSKHIFTTYQKMMLSTETLLLALQIMETYEFRNCIEMQLEKQKFTNIKSSFQSVNRLKQQLNGQAEQNSKENIKGLIIEIYSVGLLYLCHKVTDDLRYKFASNVWVQNLRLQIITKEDIKNAEGKIVLALQFDILRPTIFTFISVLMQQMSIRKIQFANFVHYLLEIYMNENMSKFTGERNRVKRVNLVLGGIKLGCHFLCPKLWNEAILTGLNIGLEGIEKYSRILFGLFMDKGHNQMIHEKYKMSRYRSVSRIKIINSKNLQKKNVSQREIQSTQQSSGSEQDNKENILHIKDNSFGKGNMNEITC